MGDVDEERLDPLIAMSTAALRALVEVAGRAGAEIDRAREDAARRAVVRSIDHARQLDARYEHERAEARRRVRSVRQPTWWSHADAEAIARAWETTSAWRHDDRTIADTHAFLIEQLRERYGIDPDA